jgi:hypothetical protein
MANIEKREAEILEMLQFPDKRLKQVAHCLALAEDWTAAARKDQEGWNYKAAPGRAAIAQTWVLMALVTALASP